MTDLTRRAMVRSKCLFPRTGSEANECGGGKGRNQFCVFVLDYFFWLLGSRGVQPLPRTRETVEIEANKKSGSWQRSRSGQSRSWAESKTASRPSRVVCYIPDYHSSISRPFREVAATLFSFLVVQIVAAMISTRRSHGIMPIDHCSCS